MNLQIKHSVLLVEDDFNLGNVLKDFLELEGFAVTLKRDGKEGCQAFDGHDFNLIILDVMMPKLDGFSVAEYIREKNKKVPIIFLTAKGLKEDILKGYKTGADDYLTKPFDTEVLIFKINAMIRRSATTGIDDETTDFNIGKYYFDYKLRTISLNGQKQKLSPKEADLLRLLCLHMNDLLPRQKALKLIWGDDNYFNGRSMDVFITRLRKYFREDAGIEIVTLHGKGIRLLVNSSN